MKAFILASYWGLLSYLLLSPEPMWFMNGVSAPVEGPESLPDYVQHFMAFFVLGYLVFSRQREVDRQSRLLWIALLYALLTEGAQYFIPGRFCSFNDFVFNLFGLACGCGGVILFQKFSNFAARRPAATINS